MLFFASALFWLATKGKGSHVCFCSFVFVFGGVPWFKANHIRDYEVGSACETRSHDSSVAGDVYRVLNQLLIGADNILASG